MGRWGRACFTCVMAVLVCLMHQHATLAMDDSRYLDTSFFGEEGETLPEGQACPLNNTVIHRTTAHSPACVGEGAAQPLNIGRSLSTPEHAEIFVDIHGSQAMDEPYPSSMPANALSAGSLGDIPSPRPFGDDPSVTPFASPSAGMHGDLSNATQAGSQAIDAGGELVDSPLYARPVPYAEYVESLMAELSLNEKIGQLIMVGFRGTGDLQDPAIRGVVEGIQQGKIGGVILFDYDVSTQNPVRNIVSLEQVGQLTRRLQRLAAIPLFVGIDQEGGRVMRLKGNHGMPELASAKYLGAGPVEAAQEAYTATAKALACVGINVNFAPSVDVDVDPLSPAIGKLGRSYSAEPVVVASHAEAFASTLEQHGIMAAFKHFPGHGSAANDTHLGLADITETWESMELAPYKELLPKHPHSMVMVGHVFHKMFDERFPASLSKNIITGILRNDLGWQGLVITDDLDMQAISHYYSVKESAALALNAGVDILLFGNNLQYDPALQETLFQGVVDLVEEGQVSEERIDEACSRVLLAKYGLQPIQ